MTQRTTTPCRVAILGASGYTGSELLRCLLLRRAVAGDIEIVALTSSSRAGRGLGSILPQFSGVGSGVLPILSKWEEVDWGAVDVAFCALPHGTTQEVIAKLWRHERLRIIDLSADFRLHDLAMYERWYGKAHAAPELQSHACYGLSEWHREKIASSRLVANPGCYAAACQLALLPIAERVDLATVFLSAASGTSGAGRSLREDLLYCEVNENFRPYAVGGHRHVAEIEQGLAWRLGVESISPVSFVPHLLPLDRGILVSMSARLRGGETVGGLRAAIAEVYAGSIFVDVLGEGEVSSVKRVRGTNCCLLSVCADRREGWVLVFSAIDNLVKGASGQALQNMNLLLGLDEGTGFGGGAFLP